MKILLIKMSSMGDVIHAMPVLTDVLNHYPDAQMDWVVEQGFADLLHCAVPKVGRVIPIQLRAWRKTWWRKQTRQEWHLFKVALQEQAYDVVIDCQGLLKSVWVARLAKLAPNGRLVGYDKNSIREALACRFYRDTYAVSRQGSAIERNRSLCAQALGYVLDAAKPQVDFPSLPQVVTARDDWQAPSVPYVVMIPNASRVEKRWAVENWLALAAQCHTAGLRTVWFWAGADERVYTQGLVAQLTDWAQMPPFLTIPQAAQCMQNAHCVIGLDSGLTHLAAALGRPTMGIYCDHDAHLAPMTAHRQRDDQVASLGGVGKPPTLASVQTIIQKWLVL